MLKKAKRKYQKIEEVVEDWLLKALCKEMYEKTLVITQLIKTSKFDQVGHHVALPCLEFFPPMYVTVSKSSTFALNEIIEALKDFINMIWGWGIKRVGKTTLVHAAGNKIKESQLFNDVAMAIVSETPDVGEIQDTIADSLDIKFERRN
ncbi:hypothetical protein Gotur_016444 [Gossypium turneri]